MSDITPPKVIKAHSDLALPIDGWQPYKLPELATNGFPFAPTFIVRKNAPEPEIQPMQTRTLLPFGFYFRRQPSTTDRPVIDLTKGYYDPHTQQYTVPLRAGGDTEGGTYESGSWTYSPDDGQEGTKEWDVTTDYETD